MALVVSDPDQVQFLTQLAVQLFLPATVHKIVAYWAEVDELCLETLLATLDQCEFAPKLCIPTRSVWVLSGSSSPIHYVIPLTFLLPGALPGEALRTHMYNLNLLPGCLLPVKDPLQCVNYYMAILDRLPQRVDIMARWHQQRPKMLAGRDAIWQTLWTHHYKYRVHLPPPLTSLMFPYGSALAIFVQRVYQGWLQALAGPHLTRTMDNLLSLLAQPWRIDSDRHLGWHILWNRIMDHTGSFYWPVLADTALCALHSKTVTGYMRTCDRLVCVLLLLYHKPYWHELLHLREPLPQFIHILREQFPDLVQWTTAALPITPPLLPAVPSSCSSSSC